MPDPRLVELLDSGTHRLVRSVDAITDDQWRQPSLCAGWTVRDVAAHLTLQQLGPGAVLAQTLQWRGSIDRTTAAFPGYPPYGDPALEPVPHCTVGVVDDPAELPSVLEALRDGLEPLLPIRCEARDVALLAERDDGSWAVHTRFPLEGEA